MLRVREFWLDRGNLSGWGARAACTDLIRLSPSCALPDPRGGRDAGLAMSGTKIDRHAAPASASANRNDKLIARAAKRADLAATALESAGADLDGAHDSMGDPLTGLAEVVLDEAARVSHLAEDIESQRAPEGGAERTPLDGVGRRAVYRVVR
jgi:hypothetical protein